MSPTRTFQGRRLLGIVAALLIALALLVGGLTLASAPSGGAIGSLRFEVAGAGAAVPTISREAAEAGARAILANMEPGIQGFTVVASGHVGALKRVVSASGDNEFRSMKAINAWVFELKGEPTATYKNVSAVVIVDAVSGEIKAASLDQSN